MPVAVLFGASRTDSNRRLGVLAVALVVQSVLLVVLRADPTALPPSSGPAMLALSAVTAAVLGLDAYRYRDREVTSWWRPDWRLWALAGLPPGANVGFSVAYLLRRWEGSRYGAPSGQWKLPLAVSVVAATVGTVLVVLYFDIDDPNVLVSALLFALLVLSAFVLVAVFYDTRYVAGVLETGGSEWLLNGYHWVVLVGVPIRARVLFLLVYLYRRRTLLDRAAQDAENDASGAERTTEPADGVAEDEPSDVTGEAEDAAGAETDPGRPSEEN